MNRCLFVVFAGLAPLAVLAQKGPTDKDFFDENVVQELRIEIHPGDWQKLQDNFRENIYYPANISWRDQYVENVGIRSKGRTSRRASKPGLRVDINRFEDQEFLGLKAFLLDNNVQDFSMLKERIGMLLFNKMGIPSPRETHAKVYINNQYAGLFGLVESTDKAFLKRNFQEDDGYLYEYVFLEGFRFQYLGEDPAKYSPLPFKPETHENKPDPKPIEEMIRAINQSSDAEFVQRVSEYIDLKKFLTTVAVEAYLTEFDGILSDAGMNNWFFYRFEKKKLGQIIPKDKDNTFNANDWSVLKNAQDNVLMRRALAVPALREHYFNELLRACREAGGVDGWMQLEMDRIYKLIREAALSDNLKECPDGACTLPQSNEVFERFYNFVRDIAGTRAPYVRNELNKLGFAVPPEEVPSELPPKIGARKLVR